MTLKEFLDARVKSARLDRGAWLERVRDLFDEIQGWMRSYDPLVLEEWNILIVEGSDKYNAPALTIQFQDAHITVQPKGGERRLEAVCGARAVYLEWSDTGWRYRFQADKDWKPLTKEAFADTIVQGLLA